MTYIPANSYHRGRTPMAVVLFREDDQGNLVPDYSTNPSSIGTTRTVDVGVTGSEALVSNPSRRGFVIKNQSYPGGPEASVWWGTSGSVVVPSAVAGNNRGQEIYFGDQLQSGIIGSYTGPIFLVAETDTQVSVVEW